MSRKIEVLPGVRGVVLHNGLVITSGDVVVVSDEQWSVLGDLVSMAHISDLGSTTEAITPGRDESEFSRSSGGSGGGGGSTEVTNFPADYPDTAVLTAVNDLVAQAQVASNAVYTGQMPTTMAADEEFFGPWVDVSKAGHMIAFYGATTTFATVELQWSDDGVSPTGYPSVLVNEPQAGYNLYLTILSTFTSGTYVRTHIINGPDDMGAYPLSFSVFSVGLQPFIPLTTVRGNLNQILRPVLTRSISAGEQPDGDLVNLRADGLGWEYKVPGDADSVDAAEVIVSPITDTDGFRYLQITITSDQPSADGGILLEYLDDAEADTPVLIDVDTATFTASDAARGYMTLGLEPKGNGYRLIYTHGSVPVANFRLAIEHRVAPLPAMRSNKAKIDSLTQATLIRGTITQPDENGDWENIQRRGGSLTTTVTGIDDEVRIAPKSRFGVRGVTVTSISPVVLPIPPLTGIGTLSIQNEGVAPVYMAETAEDATIATRRLRLDPGVPFQIDVSESVTPPWLLAADVEGATVSDRLGGDTAVGGANPSDALASDDARAALTAGQTLEVSGFNSLGVQPTVSSVQVGFEGRISATSPATEDVSAPTFYTVVGGNVGSLTSPSVPATNDAQYLAAVTTKKGSALVNSVDGCGLTWELAGTPITDDSGDTRITLWRGTGTPVTGTVTATFSTTATNCTIAVMTATGVDLGDPVENYETLGVSGTTDNYADSIVGTDKGLALTFVTNNNRTHIPGSGFTEDVNDIGNGGNSGSLLSVSSLQLTSTAPHPYSGAFSGNTGWVLIAVTLRPRPVDASRIRISYEVGGSPGSSTLDVALTSSDTGCVLDVTADRDWTQTDVDNISVLLDVISTGLGIAGIDYVFVDETESEDGASQFVTCSAVGDA